MSKVTESDIANRAQTAGVMETTVTTLDTWVKRGCPVISRSGKGRSCSFSLTAVRKWRAKDLQRKYPPNVAAEMAKLGKEHVNGLRDRVEDAAKHFLWWSFAAGAPILVDDLVQQKGFKDIEAKRLLGTFYLYRVHPL